MNRAFGVPALAGSSATDRVKAKLCQVARQATPHPGLRRSCAAFKVYQSARGLAPVCVQRTGRQSKTWRPIQRFMESPGRGLALTARLDTSGCIRESGVAPNAQVVRVVQVAATF